MSSVVTLFWFERIGIPVPLILFRPPCSEPISTLMSSLAHKTDYSLGLKAAFELL